jgi:hypothetical protein
MVEKTRKNPNAIIYGTFHSYPVMLRATAANSPKNGNAATTSPASVSRFCRGYLNGKQSRSFAKSSGPA